jgi:hypothetical protein
VIYTHFAIRSWFTPPLAAPHRAHQMQVGCNTARSETIKRIKDNMVRYLAAGQNPVMVKVHWQARGKRMIGINDPDVSRLLIPAEDLQEWDEDPELYVNVVTSLCDCANNRVCAAPGLRLTTATSLTKGRTCQCSCTKTTHTIQMSPRRAFSRDRSWFA